MKIEDPLPDFLTTPSTPLKRIWKWLCINAAKVYIFINITLNSPSLCVSIRVELLPDFKFTGKMVKKIKFTGKISKNGKNR